MRITTARLSSMLALMAPLAFAESAPPIIDLSLNGTLANAGTLGGEATITVYAPGEAAVFDEGPLGGCVDFTQASRHGGLFFD